MCSECCHGINWVPWVFVPLYFLCFEVILWFQNSNNLVLVMYAVLLILAVCRLLFISCQTKQTKHIASQCTVYNDVDITRMFFLRL